MTIRFTRGMKLMGAGIALSMVWFVLSACECDETKEQNFPGFWVTCVANKPTLMTYNDNNATIVAQDQAGNFDPRDWDCSHDAGSPSYKGSQSTSPFTISTPLGPGGPINARGHQAAQASSQGVAAYLPQVLRLLPFVPQAKIIGPATCDSTFPDVFRTDQLDAQVTRIGTCPFQVKARISVPPNPLQVAVTPDGTTAVVTSFFNAISFIDLSSNRVTFTLNTDSSINPHGLAISPDGKRAYVTSFNTNNAEVLVIDMASKQILTTIQTIAYPQGATLTPDGSQLWITSPLGNVVDVIDTLSNTRVTGRSITQATDVAFNSTGTRAYITSNPNSVVVVDTGTYQVIKTYTVGQGPTDIAMSYGDGFLVVTCQADGTTWIIDLVKNKLSSIQMTQNPTGDVPSGIAFVH
jgi:YVTN family beta-propeller protein